MREIKIGLWDWKAEKEEEILNMQKQTGIALAEFNLTGLDFGHLHEDEGEGVENSVRLGCRSVDMTDYAKGGITTVYFDVL